ncbi:hypothetical protein [Streptacidiphilus neutrinimicus]|uniref:hypothetical protein n=1 Tax=Streptacidiphilus neutrinimicus TaxID=105420 RepID=UPI0005A723A7|nr:hypothetical protein [Streptacidiphilus neutrinimicus]
MPLALGSGAVVLGFVLVVIAQKLLRLAGSTHTWGEVLVGGGIIALLCGFGCFFAYLADSATGPDDDSSWDAFIGQ